MEDMQICGYAYNLVAESKVGGGSPFGLYLDPIPQYYYVV